MKRFIIFLLISLSNFVNAKGTKKITYGEAIRIALKDSYTVKYYKEEMDATHFSYLYTRAQFKPYLDFDIFAPSWKEELMQIYQADGLPVYNTAGSFQVGGNLAFTYVLPTGGSFSLSSRMYWENYRTFLDVNGDKKLSHDQFYSRFAITFNQPIFTTNKLRENMKLAELDYQKNSYYFTRVQMDIVYNVTQSFYKLYESIYECNVQRERLENSREAYRISCLKYETGDISEGELLISEITVAQNEVKLMEYEGRLETGKDEFKLLIGLELDEEIDLLAEMDFETFYIDINKAIQEALSNRLEINEEKIDIELQSIYLKQAKRERELKGNISAYYDLTGLSTRENGNVGKLIGSSFDNMMDRPANRGIAFTLSYPIVDWGRGKNLVRKQKVRLEQANLNLHETEREIENEIRDIVRTVNEAEKRYTINRKNRDIAEKSYKISQLRFENGDMTGQELSLEQERLSQVHLSFIESYVTYRLAVANLNRKTMYDFQNKRSYLVEN